MTDILHRIGVANSSPERVYDALTTVDGLSGWWAEKTTGETDLGGVVQFRFGPGGIDMRVAELEPGRLVRWDVADGPQEWIGTSVQFDLRQDGDWTIVLFRHEGWREPVEFMHHCSTKWATFLMSLKQLLETGTGAPDPRDVTISDWH
jgi:uncharacterized protein YndB with AHSA1/START domain